jgi:hypothetical protein
MSSLLKLICRFFGWNLVCWEMRRKEEGMETAPSPGKMKE